MNKPICHAVLFGERTQFLKAQFRHYHVCNSVMHYGKNAFSNGNGYTIITKPPEYQDIIIANI